MHLVRSKWWLVVLSIKGREEPLPSGERQEGVRRWKRERQTKSLRPQHLKLARVDSKISRVK